MASNGTVTLVRGKGRDAEFYVSDDPSTTTQLLASGWAVTDKAPKTASQEVVTLPGAEAVEEQAKSAESNK